LLDRLARSAKCIELAILMLFVLPHTMGACSLMNWAQARGLGPEPVQLQGQNSNDWYGADKVAKGTMDLRVSLACVAKEEGWQVWHMQFLDKSSGRGFATWIPCQPPTRKPWKQAVLEAGFKMGDCAHFHLQHSQHSQVRLWIPTVVIDGAYPQSVEGLPTRSRRPQTALPLLTCCCLFGQLKGWKLRKCASWTATKARRGQSTPPRLPRSRPNLSRRSPSLACRSVKKMGSFWARPPRRLVATGSTPSDSSMTWSKPRREQRPSCASTPLVPPAPCRPLLSRTFKLMPEKPITGSGCAPPLSSLQRGPLSSPSSARGRPKLSTLPSPKTPSRSEHWWSIWQSWSTCMGRGGLSEDRRGLEKPGCLPKSSSFTLRQTRMQWSTGPPTVTPQ
jgi:hypothetical protein